MPHRRLISRDAKRFRERGSRFARRWSNVLAHEPKEVATMEYRVSEDGSVPVAYCERQKRWLPVEEHIQCEWCAAPVYDESGDPVSFLCTHEGAKKVIQPDWEDHAEEGRGAPSDPGAPAGDEPEPKE
jgi:hypothetical protein